MNSIYLPQDHVASDPAERARIMNEGIEVKWQVDTWRVGAAALQVFFTRDMSISHKFYS